MSKRKYRKGQPLDFAGAAERILAGRCIIVFWGGRGTGQTVNAPWARGWSVSLLWHLCRSGYVYDAEANA